jgi:hypothetical protein
MDIPKGIRENEPSLPIVNKLQTGITVFFVNGLTGSLPILKDIGIV